MVVIAIAGGFILGRAAGTNDSPPTISLPADGSSAKDCDAACVAWDNARQMACNAKNDEAAARARADGLRGQVVAALATAVSLATAAAATFVAAAAAAGTIFGLPAAAVLTGIAVGLAISAAVAFLIADGFVGAMTAAEADASAKTSARQTWDAEVARLRALVNSQCPPDKANACLSRASPC
ncbi:MAG: hypothetical protein ACREBO_01775 [Novosphingobium sp.]